ncbi:MAG TPA: F0F1 ATP synthase subunit delta [Steroidobacteraceae bacterium]|jgi:F-type H+-transporting ATPase subunit delta|nr:F0F1 ATP synthase subunit delta [Steroidobacteraceae bacterium]
MVEKVTLARPYARAAFAAAQEHKDFERWSQMLAAAAATVADARVIKLLSSPRVQPTDLVELIAEASSADEHGRNFLNTLAVNRRLAVLPEVAAMYEELRAEVENITDVHVTSAVQLDAAQRARLTAALKKRLKREVRLHCAVDASLIGGAIVRAGDFVIDGSLKARLERLASQIMH